MNGRAAKWAVALVLSAVLHAGAAVWFGVNPDEVEVAGGAQAEIAVLGNVFQDSLAAGSASEAVEPTKSEADAMPPTRSEPVETRTPEPVKPQDALETAQQPSAATVESSAGEIAVAAIEPSPEQAQPDEPVKPAKTPAVEPQEADIPPMPQTAPQPTPRPTEIAKAEPEPKASPPPRVKSETKPVEKPRAQPRQRAGAGGRNEQTARRGSADGSDKARKAEAGVSGRSREAGDAAVSNYPGQVYSKLRRSLRYPAEARRKHIRGEVHVRFTVSRSGGVGSVSVARGSGSPVLDKAALETVRRAAPFPAIPPEAGRSSWSFTVPLAFTR